MAGQAREDGSSRCRRCAAEARGCTLWRLLLACTCCVSLVRISLGQEITLRTANTGLGGILTWGLNDNSQLQFGDGVVNATVNLDVPTPLTRLPKSPITVANIVATSVAAGSGHTLIGTDEGDVYAVGDNLHGQLGVKDMHVRPQLTLVDTFRDAPGALKNGTQYVVSMGRQNVVSVAAGHDYSGATTEQGKLYTWGNNKYGQLGHGCGAVAQRNLLDPWEDVTNFQRKQTVGANQVPSAGRGSGRYVETDTLLNCDSGGRSLGPRLVEGIAQTFVDRAVLGTRHTAALTGQCSADRFADGLCQPSQGTGVNLGIPILGSIQGNLEGTGAALLLGQAGVQRCVCGQLWMWGGNQFGQLGQGDDQARYVPTLVQPLAELGIHITSVALGRYHTVALSIKGNVYAWGYNANGQVGSWDSINKPLPVRVKRAEPGFMYIQSIAAGAYHTVMVSDRGDVFTFGSNREGQLGIGQKDMEVHSKPIKINMPYLRGLRVVCGSYHCLAVTITLDIYSWGWNKYGQLGLGGNEARTLPTLLKLPTSVPGFPVEYATSHGHSVMVLQTGDLTFCGVNIWGKNVCQTTARFSPFVTSDSGGSWWVVSATAGQIIVTGNEALEFPAQGNIQLYRNETDLGVYPYTSVKNLQGYKFAFDSDIMAFPTSFVPDTVSNTQLLV